MKRKRDQSRSFRVGKCFTTLACALLIFLSANAQSLEDSSDVEKEKLLDVVQTESDNSELVDRLNWLQENPFDLNKVSTEELATLPRLTPADVVAIVSLRKELKAFKSVRQITLIEGNGDDILEKIRPYVFVDEAQQVRGTTSLTSRIVRDLQPRAGFAGGNFVGSAIKNYNRFTITHADVQAGLLFEKDAGERIGDSFISGYLSIKDWSFISHAIVGDYVLEAGQGLVLWRSSAFGKSSEAVSVVKRSGLGPQPYRSADEFNFLRGVAATTSLNVGENSFDATAFYSRRSLSASGNDSVISTFYEEGLFRTQSELEKRSNEVEKIIGGRVQFRSAQNWNVGGTFYSSTFEKPIVADRLFEFNGASAKVVGVDGEVNFGWLSPKLSQVTLFGEAARTAEGANAGIVGAIINATRAASFALVYRDYSHRFNSLHATGFGERSDTKNERGFYLGADVQVNDWIRFSAYLDHFKFPWRTFDNPLPTTGRDLLLQADAAVTKELDVSLRYSNKTNENTEAGVDELARETRFLADRIQQKLRLTATYQANKKLRLRGRIEKTFVDYRPTNNSESGYLFYQELQYVLPPNFAAEARLIFFDTDSFDSRVYEYENDLRGVFANPALFGKGRRWYLLVRWKPLSLLQVSAKYSETQFDGVRTISSGLSEIQGDIDNRISVQVDVKF